MTYDEMDPASRREFSGTSDRQPQTEEPMSTPTHGFGFDKPPAPDPNDDHLLSGPPAGEDRH